MVPLMELRSRRAQQEQRRSTATQSARAFASEFAVMRMAVGLGMVEAAGGGDELAAAKAGGVVIHGPEGDRLPTAAEARELAARARGEEYAPLREGRDNAAAQLLQRFVARAAISMLEHEGGLSPAARPQAVFMAHKTITEMGGGKLSWPKVSVTFEVEEAK